MDFVTVRHPDIEGTAEVSRPAFDATYAEKGWVLVDDDTPPAPAVQPVETPDEAPAPVEQPDQQPAEAPAEQPVEQNPEQAPEPPADPAAADGRHAETPTPPIQPEV